MVTDSQLIVPSVTGVELSLEIAGPGYRGLLVFAYHLHPSVELTAQTPDLYTCRGRRYLFRAVDVDDYREHMRVRSPKWGTVGLAKGTFEKIVRPFRYYSHESPPSDRGMR